LYPEYFFHVNIALDVRKRGRRKLVENHSGIILFFLLMS